MPPAPLGRATTKPVRLLLGASHKLCKRNLQPVGLNTHGRLRKHAYTRHATFVPALAHNGRGDAATRHVLRDVTRLAQRQWQSGNRGVPLRRPK